MMHKKNSVKKTILTGMASVAKKTAGFNADNLCMWWHYQPKKPEAVKKLRKF